MDAVDNIQEHRRQSQDCSNGYKASVEGDTQLQLQLFARRQNFSAQHISLWWYLQLDQLWGVLHNRVSLQLPNGVVSFRHPELYDGVPPGRGLNSARSRVRPLHWTRTATAFHQEHHNVHCNSRWEGGHHCWNHPGTTPLCKISYSNQIYGFSNIFKGYIILFVFCCRWTCRQHCWSSWAWWWTGSESCYKIVLKF